MFREKVSEHLLGRLLAKRDLAFGDHRLHPKKHCVDVLRENDPNPYDECEWDYIDDTSGMLLNDALVEKTRAEEISVIRVCLRAKFCVEFVVKIEDLIALTI